MDENIIKNVALELTLTENQVKTVLEMINEGATVPFIARYRKEQTGALDEEKIRSIYEMWEYQENLNKRKLQVIRLIDEKGMLTDELKEKIEASTKLIEIEDLYRPYKEKKKTKATEAIAKGLKPLAEEIMKFPMKGSIEELIKPYVNENVNEEYAIEGAKYIIAEDISDNAEYRKALRDILYKYGIIETKKKKNAEDDKHVFEMYYDYNEKILRPNKDRTEFFEIKPHRILAINRGEDLVVLTVNINVDKEVYKRYLTKRVVKKEDSFVTPYVKEAIEDSIDRLIHPSIEREIRSSLTEKAEDNAINIFSINLKKLLLQAPMKGKTVLGVDPAFRTGCKLAVVDKTGKVLDIGVIYQNQKFPGENVPASRIEDAKKLVKSLIIKYNVDLVAIGNGTASRETEEFISGVLKEIPNKFYAIVSEAGASVYSASDIAREEFPDYSVEQRSAVSIARRLQDPLSELVKIDPKSIGVGQYQHDVTQSKLSSSLDFVVETAVNSVGVDVNTASKSLLQYVAGVNKSVAENIVKYRNENGEFKSREELKKVPKLGPKAFEQCIGFLRILNGKNILDQTSIHPESYDLALKILNKLDISASDLGKDELKEKINKINVNDLVNEFGSDEYTISDILKAFISPKRDPRDELDKPLLRSNALSIEDLQVGQELMGVVRNVIDFGAFVDCGLHEDGLVHISKISKEKIKHPLDVLSVGDIVKVYVLNVDLVKQKVALTMIKD